MSPTRRSATRLEAATASRAQAIASGGRCRRRRRRSPFARGPARSGPPRSRATGPCPRARAVPGEEGFGRGHPSRVEGPIMLAAPALGAVPPVDRVEVKSVEGNTSMSSPRPRDTPVVGARQDTHGEAGHLVAIGPAEEEELALTPMSAYSPIALATSSKSPTRAIEGCCQDGAPRRSRGWA